MAKQSGIGDNFYIGGYDLSGDVASIDKISSPMSPLDVTPINVKANARIGGQRDGMMQFTTFFENTGTTTSPGVPASGTPLVSTFNWPVLVTVIGGTGTQVNINGTNQGTFDGTYLVPALGTITLTYTVAPTWNWKGVATEHNGLSILPRTDTIAMYYRGTTIGGTAACVNGKQVNYDFTRDQKGALTAQVEVDGNSFGLEWGIMLTAGLRVDTAATTGAFFDNGAAFAFGAQAYFELVELVGTSVTIDIQSATTSGGAYATTGLTTTAMSAVGSQRLATVNTATINEFLKVVTTGTFTYAQFAVMINVNKAAGQVF